MNVREAASKYRALQNEALSLARELRPLAKRSRDLFKKALNLQYRLESDDGLYLKGADGDDHPDGWNTGVLFRLGDFNYGAVEIGPDCEPVSMAETLLRNLADEPFTRRVGKVAKTELVK